MKPARKFYVDDEMTLSREERFVLRISEPDGFRECVVMVDGAGEAARRALSMVRRAEQQKRGLRVTVFRSADGSIVSSFIAKGQS